MPDEGLTIGIDARAAAEVPAGRGRFVRELLHALAAREDAHRYVLYVRSHWDEPLDGRFTQEAISAPEGVWHVRAARRASRACNVFLSTNSYLTAWFTTIATAVFVHDLIPFLPGALAQRRAALIERATIRPALRRAGSLICNSHATRADLERLFPPAAAKATVVPLAADERFGQRLAPEQIAAVRLRHEIEEPFVLSAGTLEPRKNLRRLISAWAGLPPECRAGRRLVLVGPRGWEAQAIIEDASLRPDDVRLLGHVPDEELVALYQSCELFCYPSLYEGFGLPVLEAMAAGAPTLTSNVSALPEVAGDAALFVDPCDEGSIRAGLERLLRSPEERAALGRAGPRRAAAYSWKRVAEEMLAELERLACQSARTRS